MVIANGSGYIQARHAGEDESSAVIESVVTKETVTDIIYPIQCVFTRNFDNLQQLWDHIFYE